MVSNGFVELNGIPRGRRRRAMLLIVSIVVAEALRPAGLNASASNRTTGARKLSNNHMSIRNTMHDNSHGYNQDVCHMMAHAKALNEVHITYFLNQQREEAKLLDQVESRLCVPSVHDGSPTHGGTLHEATFQQRLDRMLAPYRMATRLHINMAFYAKSVCGENSKTDRMHAQRSDNSALPTYASGFFLLPENETHSGPRASPPPPPAPLNAPDYGRSSWSQLERPYTVDKSKVTGSRKFIGLNPLAASRTIPG